MATKRLRKYNLEANIRSALRKIWLWSPMRREALARARVSRGVYRCEECGEKASKLDVDHILAATPESGIKSPKDWGIFVQRLLYKDSSSMTHITVDQLRALCKPCHAAKTKLERSKRKGRS